MDKLMVKPMTYPASVVFLFPLNKLMVKRKSTIVSEPS